jgi:hypothetical protein
MKHYEITLTFTITHIFPVEAESLTNAKIAALREARTCPDLIHEFADCADIEVSALEKQWPAPVVRLDTLLDETKEPSNVIPFPRGRR